MRKVGFIVNPIAGMGGRVGLKGTDGPEILRNAKRLGAKPVAQKRAMEFLGVLGGLSSTIEFLAPPGLMGGDALKLSGITVSSVPGKQGATTAEDTKSAARDMVEAGVDLIVFCGGDGTARDLLDAVDQKVAILGVPAGVKMQSGIFASTPKEAAKVAVRYLWGEIPLREGEVVDVDEESYRSGKLSTCLYGYLMIPYEPRSIQGTKAPTLATDDVLENREAVAKYIIEGMEPKTGYILGPGSTVKAISERLRLPFTLLGVDLMRGGKIISKDANESDILKELKKGPWKIVVSPIGRQGFIFGRGNQQISPPVIKAVGREGILVIATRDKIRGMDYLRMDTGDAKADNVFGGTVKVLVDYGIFEAIRVS